MKKILFVFIVSLLYCGNVFSQIPAKELHVTYIGNEGFMFESSSHKIIIDGLYNDGYGLFAVPAKNTIEKIQAMEPPFDKIDLLMLTHYHKDHCDPELINQYLSAHKDISFVTNHPAVTFINGNIFDFIMLKKQFRELTPERNKCISEIINGILIKAYGTKHLSYFKDSIDVEEYMYNASYLINMDGISVFHSGDILMEDLKNYIDKNGKWADKIDIAFLYFDMLRENADLDYIINTLNPKQIVLMHVPPVYNDKVAAMVNEYRDKFPGIMFFKDSMEQKIFKFN